MSEADNRHPQQPHADQGWQPLPQGGEYESEATAFVQLPEGFTTGVYGGRTPGYPPGADPLAAPGHGYTPPSSFTPHAAPPVAGGNADPAATGQWTMPFADQSAGYADPSTGYPAHPEHAAHQGPSAGYPGGAPEVAQPWGGAPVEWPVAGSPEAGGGAWTVPAAADDGLEESGEYLVGHDGPAGHPGPTGGYPGGYPGAGAYDGAPGGADAGATARTGHWNFTAGLSATSGAETHSREPQEAPPGAPADDAYGDPAGGPYAPESGLAGHGTAPAPGHAGDPGVELPGGGLSGAGGYPPVAGDPHAAAGGAATGHWSLPADALAQWPPATEHAPSTHDTASDVPAPAGAEGWAAPAADGEHPADPADFTGSGEAEPTGPVVPASSAAAPAAGAAGGDTERPVDAVDAAAAVDAPLDAVVPDVATGPEAPGEPADHDGGGTGATGLATGADTAEDTGPTGAGVPAVEDPAAAPGSEASADDHDEHPAASYVLRVNGIDRPVTDAWIGESLLYVLRERLGLAGAKDGCSQGECGACSVQVDGRLVASCLVPAATAAGSEVRTVEGLAQNGVPSDVQRALAASGAVQCGFCVPGMAMTVHDLLEGNHAPTELETRKALCGNLCRCSGYRGVLDAVEEVVKSRAEAAEAPFAADEPAGATPADTARIPHQAGPADPMGHAPHDQDPYPGGTA
ncbi:2Fe-2S iron-sulfur cluster-binding protein [Streptomyces sp. NPDC048506]|uniref:2Fe-2S iron-sulfur cluster-binding protein n=1 Tax=Streptomyces sp. NPDC048506 TaxID=3155028 RepID=UPI003429C508